MKLISPDTPGSRLWVSLNGNIRPTEMHSVAYDPVSKVVFGGNQDVAISMQATLGNFAWNTFASGDGGNVAVDADQVSHPGTSIRYTCSADFAALTVRAGTRPMPLCRGVP